MKAKQAYGSYISPLSVDVGSGNAAQAVLRRVRTLVCLGREGRLLSMAAQAGVKHVIMVSQTGGVQCGERRHVSARKHVSCACTTSAIRVGHVVWASGLLHPPACHGCMVGDEAMPCCRGLVA